MFEAIVDKVDDIMIGTFVDEGFLSWDSDFDLAIIHVVSVFFDIGLDECFAIRMGEVFFSIGFHLARYIVGDGVFDFLFHDRVVKIDETSLILDVVVHAC